MEKLRNLFTIFAFVIFVFLPVESMAVSVGDVVINEIMYNLEGADDPNEWIEVFNASDVPIDLTGWKFNDGKNHILNIPPEKGSVGSIIIQSREYIILADNAATFLEDHPGFSGTVIDTVMILNNTSGNLSLIDNDGNTIYSMSYQNGLGANGNGKTLEKNENSWSESVNVGGTPGARNSMVADSDPQIPTDSELINTDNLPRSIVPSQETTIEESASINAEDTNVNRLEISGNQMSQSDSVIINEIMPYSAGPDAEEEWVEIFNFGNESADLSSWNLEDAEGSTNAYKFPEGTVLSAGSYLVLSRPTTKIILNNDADGLKLIRPDGEIAQTVQYNKAQKGKSYAKNVEEWQWSDVPTPGSANIISAPVTDNDYNDYNDNASGGRAPAGGTTPSGSSESIRDNSAATPNQTSDEDSAGQANINKYQSVSANISGSNTPKGNSNLFLYITAPILALLSALFIFILKKRLEV